MSLSKLSTDINNNNNYAHLDDGTEDFLFDYDAKVKCIRLSRLLSNLSGTIISSVYANAFCLYRGIDQFLEGQTRRVSRIRHPGSWHQEPRTLQRRSALPVHYRECQHHLENTPGQCAALP